ncbi:MAG TPA: M56 family metallopeptidase [Steroidobacteraceae bacterium]|nr:M56 family metallopeptidase [Steroidobacteraceae bacterium]
MSTHLLLEAAVRSLVMGAIVLITLRLLRIEQVRARRTAWLLTLAGALAMPVLVAAHIGPRLLPEFAFAKPFAARPQTVRAVHAVYGDYRGPLTELPAAPDQDTATLDTRMLTIDDDRDGAFASTALSLALFGYCVVATVLSLRLCAGVGFALRLRNQAERVIFPFDPELDVRASARLATPVTIGSSVLLPHSYTSWDGATLRIVLSHERAHVRQKDFHVHLLAGLHCALFWFNPFSWWLQRQLAELGEALSDCAAVEQAESRTSYAEILLAFATRSHWPLTGVAMASTSNLTPRIERLLSDRGFERSFAPRQRLPFIAAGVVALAMVASTSMVRATDTAPNAPVPPAAPSALPVPAAPSTLAPAAPTAPAAPNAPATGTDVSSTEAKSTTDTHHSKKLVKVRTLADSDFDSNDAGGSTTVVRHEDAAKSEEGILAIHSGHSRFMFDSGDWLPSQRGDYIYFQHDGKPYLIQDPQIIAKAQELLEPMKELGEKQKELGRQQSLLGAQQRLLGSQQRAIKLTESPEFKREMAELQKTIKELDLPRLTAQIDQRALAEVQAHLGEIQARVGHLQSEFGWEAGKFGEQQGRLGEEQGKLGEQQGRLGEEQRKIVEDVRRQLKPIIEQAIRDGKGKLLSDY